MEPINTSHYITDWLASQPVFYNTQTGQAGHDINEVIDFRNLEFDAEGLVNYLRFGYSVFEQTPLKNIRFLRHSSSLIRTGDNIQVQYSEDITDKKRGVTSTEAEVLDLLERSVQNWENRVQGEIVIPTSGGYDSRLLNSMVTDKSRIRSFTYGISEQQDNSYEVVYAKKISAILGTQWQQIPLGNFHHYFDQWNALFGISTHAHGMYHLEFYEKIRQQVPAGTPLLSGIIGDAWAGSVNIPALKNAADVVKLGYSHGIHADPEKCLLKGDGSLLHNYYNTHKIALADPAYRVIESMRFKMILLSYLMTVPQSLGFLPWSPFLDPEIAMAMLNLPTEARKDRIWQSEYFRKHQLNLESMQLACSRTNSLDRQAMQQVTLKPLDVKLLREVIDQEYVEQINKHVLNNGLIATLKNNLTYVPKIGGLLRRAGIKDEKMIAYNAYLTLKPIEYLLKKRNEA